MSAFKEQVSRDNDTFINNDEFADFHFIGSLDHEAKIKCIVDTNNSSVRSFNRGTSFDDNMFNCDLTIIYKYLDFPVNIRAHVDEVIFDDINYIVNHFSCDDGMVQLKLERVAGNG